MGGGARTNLTPQPNRVATHDFCVQNGLYVSRRSGVEVADADITYLLLNGWAGGRVKIDTPELERGFLMNYTRDLFEGCKELAYVQRRTPYFRFFMDLDIKRRAADGPATLAQVGDLVELALGAVREFVPHASAPGVDLDAYVLVSPPAVSDDAVKVGVHLHVPGVVLDAQTALMIRLLALRRAHERFPLGSPHANAFEDIFDQIVYVTNGLRMMGSVKYADCRLCRGRPDASCGSCGGYGKTMATCEVRDELTGEPVRRGRTYGLTQVLRYDAASARHVDDPAELARLKSHVASTLFELVCRLSVRTDATANVAWLKVPAHAEMPAQRVPTTKKAKKGAPARVYELYTDDVAGMNKQLSGADFRVVVNAEQLALLQRVLDEVVVPSDPRRAGISVRNAKETKGHFVIHPRGPGSHTCDNKRGDGMHSSSSIWFSVYPTYVEQRCFCRKQEATDTVHGVSCTQFKGRPIKLTADLRRALFPMEAYEELRQASQAARDRRVVVGVPPPLPGARDSDDDAADDEHDAPAALIDDDADAEKKKTKKRATTPARRATELAARAPTAAPDRRPPSVKNDVRVVRAYECHILGAALQSYLMQGPPAKKIKVAQRSLEYGR